MKHARVFRAALLGCFAAAGVVGAHLIDYVLTYPDALQRAAALQRTGHAYFGTAPASALTAVAIGVLTSAVIGFRGERRPALSLLRWRHTAPRLASVQIATFVLLEIAERATAGVLAQGINSRLLAIGVALQIVLAAAAAAIIVLVERTGRAVGRAFAAVPRPRIRTLRRVTFAAAVVAPNVVIAAAHAPRGPPSPLL